MNVTRLATLMVKQPEELEASLPNIYYSGVFVILLSGFIPLMQCTSVFYDNFKRMPSVIKSYGPLLLWDWYLVLSYLARDTYTVMLGYLDEGLWCQTLGFVNIAGVLALRITAAVTAYAVYRMSQGKALSDQTLLRSHIVAWVIGVVLAGLFLINSAYGPYKGLYCCIKESKYQLYATGPCFVVTFSSMLAVATFHLKALRTFELQQQQQQQQLPPLKEAGGAGGGLGRVGVVVVKRSALHALSFYIAWSLIITAGSVTALGGHVPVSLDMLAAWLAKTEPSIDSYLLLETMEEVVGGLGGGEKRE